jgi:hypothetical protein
MARTVFVYGVLAFFLAMLCNVVVVALVVAPVLMCSGATMGATQLAAARLRQLGLDRKPELDQEPELDREPELDPGRERDDHLAAIDVFLLALLTPLTMCNLVGACLAVAASHAAYVYAPPPGTSPLPALANRLSVELRLLLLIVAYLAGAFAVLAATNVHVLAESRLAPP